MADEQERNEASRDFLPNLCATPAVLSLVLVGELIALGLELARSGVNHFDWSHFGIASLLIQWVILPSAGTICLLRPWFRRFDEGSAAGISYAIVLAYTLLFSLLSLVFRAPLESQSLSFIADNLLIAAIFAGIILRYLYLQQQLNYRKRAELQARVEALQSRIRPHFLFNSLNSIASLVATDAKAAEKLVIDLSKLFRSSLKGSGFVPIETEIELCYRFAHIEKVRLGERLKIEWHIGELPEDTAILNLLLQPLLENAIYHGIQPLDEGGTVKVEIHEVKGDVVIKISNPYRPGARSDADETRGNGIALTNIRHRLEAHYGKKGYLRIVKSPADFTVILRYPLQNSGPL